MGMFSRALVITSLSLAACGPTARNGGPGGGGDGTTDASGPINTGPENTPTACSDGVDNDGDGYADCSDPDCSGVGNCPVCGSVDHPLSAPLALPDGVGATTSGAATCTNDASCVAGQHCFDIPGTDLECRESYIAKLHYMSFGATQKFALGNLQQVCVNMEHSWMRDLRIDLVAPSGEVLQLQKMLGQTGSEIYLGKANDCDSDASPVPGTGAMYCWSPTATKPAMLDYANGGGAMSSVANCAIGTSQEMPPDTYAAADPWSKLVGASLNGDWELRITDLWPIDNGYIFSWSMTWDPTAVENCMGPIIL